LLIIVVYGRKDKEILLFALFTIFTKNQTMKKLDKLIKQRYELTMKKIELEGKAERGAATDNDNETLRIVLEKLEDITINFFNVGDWRDGDSSRPGGSGLWARLRSPTVGSARPPSDWV